MTITMTIKQELRSLAAEHKRLKKRIDRITIRQGQLLGRLNAQAQKQATKKSGGKK